MRYIFLVAFLGVLVLLRTGFVLAAVDYGTFTCTPNGAIFNVANNCKNGGTIGSCALGAGTYSCNAPAGAPAAAGGGLDIHGSCGIDFVDTAIGCVPTTKLDEFLKFMLKWIFGAAGGIIVLMVIFTGYTLLTSSGNPEKLKQVQESVVSIISGLLLIVFSILLLQVIGVDILGLPGFRIP